MKLTRTDKHSTGYLITGAKMVCLVVSLQPCKCIKTHGGDVKCPRIVLLPKPWIKYGIYQVFAHKQVASFQSRRSSNRGARDLLSHILRSGQGKTAWPFQQTP